MTVQRLLIIGGTQFVGRHIAEQALARGHAVTLFNRGKTNAGLFPTAEQITGDRKDDLSALHGRHWDAVIDTCGYTRKPVAAMCQLLQNAAGHYTFISSVSAYAGFATPNDESSATGTLSDEYIEIVDGQTYGPLKAVCEREVRSVFGSRSLIIRPGLIVGPLDPTDRFTYWVARMARAQPGDVVLAPEPSNAAIQYIDVRDLAQWTLDCVERRLAGTFNAICPPDEHRFSDLLAASQHAAATQCKLQWVMPEFLLEHEVAAWTELPLWLPPTAKGAPSDLGDMNGFMRSSTRAAQAAGLVCRPLRETVQATHDWWVQLPAERKAQLKAGLSADKERAVLAAWHASRS
jgi:2'-hydroxyisoflavone reductase